MTTKQEISDTACLLAMLMTPGVGVVTLNRLVLALHQAGIPLHAVASSPESVLGKGLPAGLEWAVQPLSSCESATLDRASLLYQRVLDTGGQWVLYGDEEYPEILSQCMGYYAPPMFSVYGDLELLKQPGVSIVGARDASEHGVALAKELARWSAENGRCVISGGAQGIDLCAHQAALESDGTTALFIPEGCLSFSGPKWLRDYIDGGKAVVISQSIPDTPWTTSAALTRNKTIAALGELVCTIDPGVSSGSRQTAEHALRFEKRSLIYAYDKLNSAYHDLMREGAYPAISESGQWDDAYVEHHWRNRQHDKQEQTELF